ncbi:ribokinase [Comamonas sp. GB3 AK4-5]|uniref:ribokinase n=1 Tax=Comamonas sp. GB3 AK4-5 TaxID=3231487 RepID=UPI00351E8CF3
MVAPLSSGALPRTTSAAERAAAGLPHRVAHMAVVGSLNMDLVLTLERMPQAGETVLAQTLQSTPGGKGGNQALACARQGAEVTLFASVGRDQPGNQLRLALHAAGINVEHVAVQESVPTGTAVVMVEPGGENRICVVAGANAELVLPEEALLYALAQADFLLLQLEVPDAVVLQALQAAHSAGCRVVLNPSPVRMLPAAWWPLVHTLVVNAQEAAALTGLEVDGPAAAQQTCQALLARGVQQVVLTLGAQGAVAGVARGSPRHHAALDLPVVDTTGAGDSFLGAMVTRLAEGDSLADAVDWGIRAASLCMGKAGAQPSIPTRAQVEALALVRELE